MSRRVVMRMWSCMGCELRIDQPAEEDKPAGEHPNRNLSAEVRHHALSKSAEVARSSP
jgi:hypothetical protein